MGARKDAQTDDVDVLLKRRVRDHLRCLEEPGVDHLKAGVAKRPDHHFRARS